MVVWGLTNTYKMSNLLSEPKKKKRHWESTCPYTGNPYQVYYDSLEYNELSPCPSWDLHTRDPEDMSIHESV